jgi:hypothetical protein
MAEIHRRCETCTWWQRRGPALSAATRDPAADEAADLGACQFGPPTMTQMGQFGMLAGAWPQTRAHRFCREWRTMETGGPDDGEQAPVVVPLRKEAA